MTDIETIGGRAGGPARPGPLSVTVPRRTRREFLIGTGSFLLLGGVLAGCGGGEGAGGGQTTDEARAIGHKYGRTEVPESPERVVTVGLTDHDAVLALGVKPVGVTDWYGDHPHATWPWARDELGDAEPVVVGDATALNFEKIAAQEPDLILGLYSGLTEKEYETLSRIAPTVAQPGEHVDYGVPWQEQTRIIGRALGREKLAEERVAEVEARLEAVREEHPEFEGASAAIATPYEGIYVYSPDVANGRLLSSLGFEIPGEIERLVGEADGASLSLERVELLDVDALVWLDAREGEGPLSESLYRRLPVHEEGREVFLASDGELGGASFVSVLSLPFLLDELAPMLAAAVDGDPETEVASAS